MTEPNYYTLFGINSDATAEQIRLAFRKAILEHHPDKNGGKSSSQEWTILLKEAYDVLSDPTERSRYDARLKFQQPPPPGQTPPPRERPNPSASTPPPRQPPPSTPPNTGEQKRAKAGSQANARQDNGQEAGWQQGDFACQHCKVLDETLRICVFRSVVSLLFFTRTALVEPGIYCAPCRLRLGLKWSLQCFVMGWWGFPFGILWTVAALFNNLRGGVQGHSQNASLLECVGAILLHKGDVGTATLALLKSRKLDEHRPEAKRLLAEALQQTYAPRLPRTFRQRLNHLPPSAYALPVMLLVGLFLLRAGNTDTAQTERSASIVTPATSPPATPTILSTVPVAAPDPVSLPSGTVLKRWQSDAFCYMTINNGNDRDAIVKLCVGNSLRYAMYVRANDTATLWHINPETYTMKYSVGVDADKQGIRFRGEHNNFRSDNFLTFGAEESESGQHYSTETITLHPVTGGNMPSAPAEDDDFGTDDGSVPPPNIIANSVSPASNGANTPPPTLPDVTPAPTPVFPAYTPKASPPSVMAPVNTVSDANIWVNTRSGKYFRSSSRWYGLTKQGAFMSESDAQAKGYVAALRQ